MLNGTAVEYGLDCCDHHSLGCGLLLGRGSGLLWWLGGKTTHAECLQEGGFSLSRAVARITALIKVLGEDASTGLCGAVLCGTLRCAAAEPTAGQEQDWAQQDGPGFGIGLMG